MKKLFSFIPAAHASTMVNISATDEFANLGNITLTGMIPTVIRVILIVAALVALIFLIIGGIKWITSGGDKAQVESARGTVTAALIGLVIVFAAWAIMRMVGYFFGINILEFNIPTINTSV
ncbi:hypothetical protein ACFL0Y_04350 [Patescibacteria group bacterium]